MTCTYMIVFIIKTLKRKKTRTKMITIMMIINNKKVTFHWFLLICIFHIGLRKGSRFSLIKENIVQLGVIFCKRTRYAGNDITQLAQSPQK